MACMRASHQSTICIRRSSSVVEFLFPFSNHNREWNNGEPSPFFAALGTDIYFLHASGAWMTSIPNGLTPPSRVSRVGMENTGLPSVCCDTNIFQPPSDSKAP